MEKLLLRNYYSALTFSSIGDNNVTEDVAQNLSPRYSRAITGAYQKSEFAPYFIKSNQTFRFVYGVTGGAGPLIWFGKNTAPVTFEDYAPVGDYVVSLSSNKTRSNTTYDDSTKTYTYVSEYTLTNNSSNELPVNEILIGNGDSGFVAYIRELLGENSFTIGANESVKFELTIKYTIAEPLQ